MSWQEAYLWGHLHGKFIKLKEHNKQPLKDRVHTRKGKKPKPLAEHWFYSTHKMVEEDTGMKTNAQDRLIKKLKKKKLLDTKRISESGKHPVRHFRLYTIRLQKRILKAKAARDSQP